jgi:hypothetical protein
MYAECMHTQNLPLVYKINTMVTQHNSTNIKKSLAIFLEMENIRYDITKDTEEIQLVYTRFSFDHGTLDYYIDYNIMNQMINFVCVNDTKFDEKYHAEIRKYYSYISSYYHNTSFMNLIPEGGQSISSSSIFLNDVDDLSLNLIQRHFSQNYFNFQQYFLGVLRIAYAGLSAKDALSEVIAK